MPDFEILAENLHFPEGPIAMPDGSVILVEIKRGTLTRVWNGKSEVIAEIGGGPNGAAFGPDGAIYLTNNGGFAWHDLGGLTVPGNAADDYTTGRIERVGLASGKIERLYDTVDGQRLSGPNDLVFDKAGGFWFTDLGKNYRRSKDRGGLHYAKPDGSLLKEASYGHVGLNGVGLAPDERVVYAAETETGKLWAFDIIGQGEVAKSPLGGPSGRCVAVQPYHCFFDSLAVQANGDICVATILNGGVTTITPAGASTHTPFPDLITTNICFGGADMRDAFITLSSTGKLVKARWPEPGLKLNFNPY
jgi:gluconolactonase